MAVEWLRVGDTVRAIEAITGVFQNRPRYDVRLLYPLWTPGPDGLRHDPRFQEALFEAMEGTGLSGTTLRRAQGIDLRIEGECIFNLPALQCVDAQTASGNVHGAMLGI